MKTQLASLVALALTACSSASLPPVASNDSDGGNACPSGTFLLGNECVPLTVDSGGGVTPFDSGGPTGPFDASSPDAADANTVSFTPPADAGPTSGFAIDPAHDNAQLDAAIQSPLVPAWTVQFTGAVSYPVIVGSTAIVAAAESQANVRALALADGGVVWGPIVVGAAVTLAAEGTTLFALDTSGKVVALDAASGTQLWAVQLEGQIDFESPPVASGGLVYVNGLESGGTTYALDEKTGNVIWTANTFDGSFGTVAVSGGMVFEAEACDQVSAFNAVTGALDWYHSTSCTGGGGAAPAAYQGSVWVRDVATGNVILDTSGNVTGSFEADVVPSFHDGTTFYLSASTLTAVTIASNTQKWSFSGDQQLCTSAVIAGGGGQVFVGSRSGAVYELDETSGAQRSVSDAGAAVSCGSETQSIALAPGRLLVPTGNALVAY